MPEPEPTLFDSFHQEQWRPVTIDGFSAIYSVSDRGRVRREVSRTRTKAGLCLKPKTARNGYQLVCLCGHGRRKWISVHHLVAFAFIGQAPGPIGRRPHEWQIDHANTRKT